MICSFCTTFPLLSDETSSLFTGKTGYRIDSVRSHFSSEKHEQWSKVTYAAQRRENEEHFEDPIDVAIRKISEKNSITFSLYVQHYILWYEGRTSVNPISY